jgi:hypothetical protein
VSRGFAYARGFGPHTWNFTLRIIRSLSFCFLHTVQYIQSLVKYWVCAPSDSKMGTEAVGTLTHADAPQQGDAPYIAPHPVCKYHLQRYTYEIILCGCYACGSIPHAWANSCDTKNEPYTTFVVSGMPPTDTNSKPHWVPQKSKNGRETHIQFIKK